MASRKNAVRPYTRTEQVQTTLTKPEREQLDARATELVVSRAELIHRLIIEGLKPLPRDPVEEDDEVARVHREMQRLQEIRKEMRR